jgi:hypothetical protein
MDWSTANAIHANASSISALFLETVVVLEAKRRGVHKVALVKNCYLSTFAQQDAHKALTCSSAILKEGRLVRSMLVNLTDKKPVCLMLFFKYLKGLFLCAALPVSEKTDRQQSKQTQS